MDTNDTEYGVVSGHPDPAVPNEVSEKATLSEDSLGDEGYNHARDNREQGENESVVEHGFEIHVQCVLTANVHQRPLRIARAAALCNAC